MVLYMWFYNVKNASGQVYAKKKYISLLLSTIVITFQLHEIYQNGPMTTLFLFRISSDKKTVFYKKQQLFSKETVVPYIDILKCVSISNQWQH